MKTSWASLFSFQLAQVRCTFGCFMYQLSTCRMEPHSSKLSMLKGPPAPRPSLPPITALKALAYSVLRPGTAFS